VPLTALEGIVENGKIRLPGDVSLPENARVYVIVADGASGPTTHVRSPRLADSRQAVDFRKLVIEVPPDAQL
jgi:hypothetical protein